MIMTRLSVRIFHGEKRMRKRPRMIVDQKATNATDATAPWQSPHDRIRIRHPIEFVFVDDERECRCASKQTAKHGPAGQKRIDRIKRIRKIMRRIVEKHVE